MTGKILSAAFFASKVPFASISSPSRSIDARPTVNPDIKPLVKTKISTATEYITLLYVVAALFTCKRGY